jgi:hypothetical protein
MSEKFGVLLAKPKTMAVLQSALWLRPHRQVGAEASSHTDFSGFQAHLAPGPAGVPLAGARAGLNIWLRGRSKVDIATRSKSSLKTPTANFLR